jgi:hypothetical protein
MRGQKENPGTNIPWENLKKGIGNKNFGDNGY